MNTDVLTRATSRVIRILNKNSPTILTGLSVAGFITTVVLAIKATPRALELIEEETRSREQLNINPEIPPAIPLNPIEVIELTWKCYLPTVVMGSVSIACVIGANSINLRRSAALASLYSITDKALHEYQAKVVEQLGEKKEEAIRSEIAQDKLNDDPIEKNTIIVTGKGEMLCYDSFSGRYFKSDIETIRKVQNDFNHRLLSENELRLNELYYELGLEPIDVGNEVGWSSQLKMLEISFDAKISTDGQPCIVMMFKVQPLKMW